MSLIEQITVLGIKCDRKGCERALYGPEMTYFVGGHRYYERLAASEGWTFWVGRSRKVFCPDHGPSRGSKMWQSKPLDAPVPAAVVDPAAGDREEGL